MVNEHPLLKFLPSVFAVGNEYQIFTVFDCPAIVKVRIGDEEFYDDSNGILRSNTNIHHVSVPISLLDEHQSYTIVYQHILERKPYFPTSEEEMTLTVKFRPVRGKELNIYLISDTHNMKDEPIACGSYFGDDIDLLVMNGDIPDHSGTVENFNAVFEIAGTVTKGECPAVFARGNHDTRGIHAEEFVQYTPNAGGKTYYTFRVGSVWGLVLDCGEDKNDGNPEYGGTVCFHNFRLGETKFIKQVAESGEYNADGIEYKLVICHIPFTYRPKEEVFAIEEELYCEWSKILREQIRPTLMLCGHLHALGVSPVGGPRDHRGQACPLIISGLPRRGKDIPRTWTGGALSLDGQIARIAFNCSDGNIIHQEEIDITK